MFRKKDNEPGGRPPGLSERPGEPGAGRPALEVRTPDLSPRTVQLPGASTEPSAAAEPGKRLIVGQGISLSGEITACDRLVVEGSVTCTLNETRAIEITQTGRFTGGKAEVEEADISGLYEGELTVRKRLLIRSTGQVKGTVRYGELEIQRGGRLTGNISIIDSKQPVVISEVS